jgi:hypothetical protein
VRYHAALLRRLDGDHPRRRRLKAEDHHELLIRLNGAGQRVLHRPDVVVEHWQELPLVYAAYRARDFAPLVARRHGLRSIIDMDGHEREFPELRVA